MNNPTIDGVSREFLADLVKLASRNVRSAWGGSVCEEARALLDAPTNDLRDHCKQCAEVVKTWPEWKQNCLGGAPTVERQPNRQFDYDRGFAAGEAERDTLQSTVAQLQARITQLESEATFAAATHQAARDRIAELESGRGEPVAWVSGEQLKLCAASPREVQPNNPMMHNLPRNIAGSALQTEYCNTPLYTAPPAPVAVVLSDEQILEAMRPDIVNADGGYVFDTAKDDVVKAGRAILACLDATAALNGRAK